ncbi:MAG: hypothetical protein JSV38_15420, partial [Desulfobacterales bacterium]
LFRKLKESKFSPCCTDPSPIQGHLSKMMGYSKADLDMVAGCVGNTETVDHIEHFLQATGFQRIRIKPSEASRKFIKDWFPAQQLEEYVASATIEAVKPNLQPSSIDG